MKSAQQQQVHVVHLVCGFDSRSQPMWKIYFREVQNSNRIIQLGPAKANLYSRHFIIQKSEQNTIYGNPPSLFSVSELRVHDSSKSKIRAAVWTKGQHLIVSDLWICLTKKKATTLNCSAIKLNKQLCKHPIHLIKSVKRYPYERKFERRYRLIIMRSS